MADRWEAIIYDDRDIDAMEPGSWVGEHYITAEEAHEAIERHLAQFPDQRAHIYRVEVRPQGGWQS